MADDLSLLFRIRGDAQGAKQATAETRAAVAQLRSQLGSEFGQMQKAGQTALAGIGDNLNVLVAQRIPLIGGAFVRVSENLRGLGTESKKSDADIAKLGKTIDGLASTTGKSNSQITSFLTKFVQLETQVKRDTAAIETFGAAAAQKLIPQLEKAGAELSTVASNSTAAGASMAGMAGPIGIAIVGILASVAAVALLTKGLFDLTAQAAEWQGKLYDLSQQTGVSIETLSALDYAAQTTGGSIESITQSLVIFQGKLDEAQDSGSKTAKQFKELGITTENTEDAFRSALIALAKMPEGFEQTNAAAELFGRRGGKQVLAIIKETNGDIDGLMAKMRELNILITDEDAKAADAFNDQLKTISLQLRAVGGTIGKEVMPIALEALQEIGKFLKENRDFVDALAASAKALAFLIATPLRGAVFAITTAWLVLKPVLQTIAELYERIAAGIAWIANSPTLGMSGVIEPTGGVGTGGAGVDLSFGAGITRRKGGGGGGGKEISEGQQLLNQLTEEYSRIQAKANELTRAQAIDQELLGKKYKGTSDEILTQIRSLATWIAIEEETVESNKKKEAALKALDEFIKKQTASLREAQLQEDSWDKEIRELTVTLQAAGVSIKKETLDIIANNDAMLKAIGLTRERIVLEETRIKMMERERAVEDKNRARLRGIDLSEGDETRERRVLAPAKETISAVDQLFKHVNENLTGSAQTAALAGINAMSEAFSGLASAVGSALQAFILYGSAGTSLRKFVAEVIAGVAVMAATKAVFELAEGFAMLAASFFGIPMAGPSAAMHFKAAAMYGIIAGMATVVGRGVAGGAFTQGGSASGGAGGGGGGSNSSSGSTQIPTTDINRRMGAPSGPPATLTINLGLKDGVVAEHFRRDYLLNGPTRLVIQTDGQS